MQGIKIFFRNGTLACFLALLVSSQETFAQAVRDKGNFFARRLTVSTGFDYTFKEENASATAGINIAPRLFLTTVHTDFSFSFETDWMVNCRVSGDDDDFSKKIFFQLPALLHVNIGHGASKDFHSSLGGFLGAGWNVQHNGEAWGNGLVLDAGFRFWLFGNSFALRFTYLPGNEKIFSSGKIISLQIALGKYLADVKRNNKVSNFMKPYRN